MTILIKNGLVVNEGVVAERDILIEQGRIVKIDSSIDASLVGGGQPEVIDAAGCYVLPGMIDDQVHFREPGLTHKGCIATESQAAVAGGITSYMEMPNCNPATVNAAALQDKYDIAATKSLANHAFYLGATNDNLEAVRSIDPHLACGVKVFMGASTGNMLVNDPKALEGIFSQSPILVVTHCEDSPTIEENERLYREKFGEAIPFKYHPAIRSEEACYLSSSMAVDLAKRFGTDLHVLHLTTAKELSLFDAGPIDHKKITLEACVHHLYFSEEDYAQKGALIKCNPAVKAKRDRDALLAAVNSDVIDIIATDHAPHTWEEKQSTNYFKAPSGLPLVQHALQTLLEHVHDKTFSIETVVNKTAHNVAKRYQLKERGYLREGYWADIAIVDMNKPHPVTRESLYYLCKWSPFDGSTFRSSIRMTLVNGEIACKDGVIVTDKKGVKLGYSR